MANTLVVYYSLSGTTRKVAEQIAERLGADLDAIEDANPRRGLSGYLRSALEAGAKGLPAITSRIDPAGYQTLVIGAPVWVGAMASPLRSYLFGHQGRMPRNIASFCTMGGRGSAHVLREIQAIAGGVGGPTFAATEADVGLDRHRDSLEVFVGAIQRRSRIVSAA